MENEYLINIKFMRFCILVLAIFLASCGGGSSKNSPIEVSNQNSSTTNNNSDNSDNSINQSEVIFLMKATSFSS